MVNGTSSSYNYTSNSYSFYSGEVMTVSDYWSNNTDILNAQYELYSNMTKTAQKYKAIRPTMPSTVTPTFTIMKTLQLVSLLRVNLKLKYYWPTVIGIENRISEVQYRCVVDFWSVGSLLVRLAFNLEFQCVLHFANKLASERLMVPSVVASEHSNHQWLRNTWFW